jgi:predicted HAD superfamily phosphohydrolase YqeG
MTTAPTHGRRKHATGQLHTARRILPRLGRILRHLRPTHHLGSAASVDDAFLQRHGVRAVLWDVDGTLMGHHAVEIDPRVCGAFRSVTASAGVGHAIVSNCDEGRLLELAGIFPDLPVMIGYETPDGPAFRVRRGTAGRLRRLDGSPAGDPQASWRALRKPSGVLLEAALDELGGVDPAAALMVGDQYFTDIASANLAGVRSVKVPTLEPRSFPRANRIAQWIERSIYRALHGPVLPGPPG